MMIPLTDILVWIAIIVLAVIVLVVVAAFARVRAETGLSGGGKRIVLITGLLYGLFFFIWVKHGLDVAERPIVRVVVGTLFVLVVSALLFALKVYNQRLYAILEFLFAVTLTAQTLWELNDVIEPIEALKLLGAAYLSIRAMDNFKKGSEAVRKVATNVTVHTQTQHDLRSRVD